MNAALARELVEMARSQGVASFTYESGDGTRVAFALFPPEPVAIAQDEFEDHEWAASGIKPPDLLAQRLGQTLLGDSVKAE